MIIAMVFDEILTQEVVIFNQCIKVYMIIDKVSDLPSGLLPGLRADDPIGVKAVVLLPFGNVIVHLLGERPHRLVFLRSLNNSKFV